MLTTKIDPCEFLRRLPLFDACTPEELARIAAGTTEHHLARAATIFSRGDPARGFYVVIYGQVKLGMLSAQGMEKIVEILGPGMSFGEALMFMDRPTIVNASTLADSLLLHIAREVVLAELDRSPALARRMLAAMSRRLHGLMADVEAYSLRSGSQRVVGYLLKDEPEGDGAQVTLAVSKRLVASRLNLTPEYFSRVLHDMAERRLVAIDGRLITLLDMDGLRAYEG